MPVLAHFSRRQAACQGYPKVILVALAALVAYALVAGKRGSNPKRPNSIPLRQAFQAMVQPSTEDLISRKLATKDAKSVIDALKANSGLNPEDSCQGFDWIPNALDEFFEPARASAAESTQSNYDSLKAMHDIVWNDEGYHPGHDLVTLVYDASIDKYILHPEIKHPPNLHHKRQGILSTLESAVAAHQPELKQALKGRKLQFVITTEDFGIVWRGAKSKLPAFSLSTDEDHIDIPIPDFTFSSYPEARYANTSWPSTSSLLHLKSIMVPWTARRPDIFHRSNWGVGPRKQLMPFLEHLHRNGSDVEVLGAAVDVQDSGFIASKPQNFVWIDEWCSHKYHIHTAGFSYSAGLKYKLACGGVVFKFESRYREFYEPGLKDGVHVVSLPTNDEQGVDIEDFLARSAPKIKAVVEDTVRSAELPAIAAAGQKFALEQLTPEALQCYWLGALLRYADLYFS